jgi:hypothetical protein
MTMLLMVALAKMTFCLSFGAAYESYAQINLSPSPGADLRVLTAYRYPGEESEGGFLATVWMPCGRLLPALSSGGFVRELEPQVTQSRVVIWTVPERPVVLAI